MARIEDVNYKKAGILKGFAIYPDWLMKVLSEYNLKPVDRLMYLCLYQHADIDTGTCYPSYRILKEYTGISNNKSIKNGIDRLVEAKLVEVIAKGYYNQKDKINMANTYKIRFPYPDNWLVSIRESKSKKIK